MKYAVIENPGYFTPEIVKECDTWMEALDYVATVYMDDLDKEYIPTDIITILDDGYMVRS